MVDEFDVAANFYMELKGAGCGDFIGNQAGIEVRTMLMICELLEHAGGL